MEPVEGQKGAVLAPRRPQSYVGGKKGRKKPSRLLRDMRLVYGQVEEKDHPAQLPLRRLLKDDPKAFLSQLASLERSHQQARTVAQGRAADEGAARSDTPVSGARVEESDGGSERVLGLVERLLSEWEGGK